MGIRRGQLIRQIFVGIAIFIIAAMTLSVRYIRWQTLDIMTRKDSQLALHQMDSMQGILSQIFDTVSSDIDLLMFDSDVQAVSKGARQMNYSYYSAVKAIHSRIISMAENNRFIHSVYIYPSDEAFIGTDATGCVFMDPNHPVPFLISDFHGMISVTPYKIRYTSSLKATDFHIYRVQDIGQKCDDALITAASVADSKGGRCTVAINLYAAKLEEMLFQLFGEESQFWLFIGDNHPLLCSPAAQNVSIEPVIEQAGLSGMGFFETTLDGIHGTLTYSVSGGFRLLHFVPMAESYREAEHITAVFLFTCILSIAAVLCLAWFWLSRCLKPLRVISDKMSELEDGHLGTQITVMPRNELGDLTRRFNTMSRVLAEADRQKHLTEKSLRDLELNALRAQINPHFLFNTLNMMKWMAIMNKNADLEACIVALAEILRATFRDKSPTVPLCDEARVLRQYVIILSKRFGNMVNLSIDLSKSLENVRVPKLLMQPIVENSVHHGRYDDGRTLEISITAEESLGRLVMRISDNGRGISEDKLEQLREQLHGHIHFETLGNTGEENHVGLLNVHRRIVLMYGSEYGIHIEKREPCGTQVILTLPSPQSGRKEE